MSSPEERSGSSPEEEWPRGPEFEERPPHPGDGPPPPHPDDGPLPPPFEEEDSPESSELRMIDLLSRLHRMAFRASMKSDGLPPAQAGAIKTIILSPGMSQRELADRLRIQRATATVMLQKMEKAGYVDRRPDPEDQRIFRIFPTEAAVRLDEENRKAFNDYFDRCFSGIDAGTFRTLDAALLQIERNLREILAESPPEPPKPRNKEEHL